MENKVGQSPVSLKTRAHVDPPWTVNVLSGQSLESFAVGGSASGVWWWLQGCSWLGKLELRRAESGMDLSEEKLGPSSASDCLCSSWLWGYGRAMAAFPLPSLKSCAAPYLVNVTELFKEREWMWNLTPRLARLGMNQHSSSLQDTACEESGQDSNPDTPALSTASLPKICGFTFCI